jgi:hypothetical protein
MNRRPTLLLALASIATASAEPLSEGDRQALLEKLDALRGTVTDRAASRLSMAAAEFGRAMKSDKETLELYLKCLEKVDFEERDRSHVEFREWRRRNSGRLDNPAFALALRHQLRWTVMTLKAANSPGETGKLLPEMKEALEAIFRTPKELRDHVQILTQAVNTTVFARAYGLSGYDVEGWPMSPLQGGASRIRVDGAFDLCLFPALRAARNYDELRSAWDRRIHYEEVALGFWSDDSTDEGESPARQAFLMEDEPLLRWNAEEDLFGAGDERRAAVNLLKHLEQHLGHSRARDWEARFRELVSPAPAKP